MKCLPDSIFIFNGRFGKQRQELWRKRETGTRGSESGGGDGGGGDAAATAGKGTLITSR